MSRIQATFENLQSQGRKALIPFVTAGFPHVESMPALMLALVEAGADIIELGVPFSDPSADGAVIQRASEQALRKGVGLTQVFDTVRQFRAQDKRTPVVLMGYANPVERYEQIHGEGRFCEDAAQAGVDGVLVVDYPPSECRRFARSLADAGIDLILLLAPTSTDERIREIAQLASGYIYYVSLKGVTGSAALDTDEVKAMLQKIRQHVQIPVGVGFGIRDAQSAVAVARTADAVVIGSRLLQAMEGKGPAEAAGAARDFLQPIRHALDTMSSNKGLNA